MRDSSVLAVSLALVNLGTAHRLIGLTVDRSTPAAGPAALGNVTHATNGTTRTPVQRPVGRTARPRVAPSHR